MEKLKLLGGFLIYLVVLAAVCALACLFIFGASWLSVHLLPWLSGACVIAGAALFLILLPLSLVNKARPFVAWTVIVISYLFGLTVWMEGLLLTLSTWGVFAVIVGLLFMGIGVVPIAVLASLLHGMWGSLLELIILCALTYGSRAYSMWIANLYDKANAGRITVEAALNEN